MRSEGRFGSDIVRKPAGGSQQRNTERTDINVRGRKSDKANDLKAA